MISSTKDLIKKYSDYAAPKMKIKSWIAKGKYAELKRGLYEDNKEGDGLLLRQFICSPSYAFYESAFR